MAAVFDIAEMKQRVAATGSKLNAVAQAKQERGAHLLEVLEAVETTLAYNQQHICHLEEKQVHTLEEFRQLECLLHDLQNGRPPLLWRCFYPKSIAARADLISRLEAITSGMSCDGEKGVEGDRVQDPDTAPVHERPGKGMAVLRLVGSLSAMALVGLFSLMGSLIAMTLFTYKVNSSMPFHLISRHK
jgi:hypothetical protein